MGECPGRSQVMDDNRKLHYRALMCIAICALMMHAIIGSALATDPVARRLGGGDSKRGRDLYQASCVICHGPHAEGKVGPALARNPILENETAFQKTVHEGRHIMPPLKDNLSDEYLADILAWLRTLP